MAKKNPSEQQLLAGVFRRIRRSVAIQQQASRCRGLSDSAPYLDFVIRISLRLANSAVLLLLAVLRLSILLLALHAVATLVNHATVAADAAGTGDHATGLHASHRWAARIHRRAGRGTGWLWGRAAATIAAVMTTKETAATAAAATTVMAEQPTATAATSTNATTMMASKQTTATAVSGFGLLAAGAEQGDAHQNRETRDSA
jgi:hypothetical protein